MPCVIGRLDGTHIPIKAPHENEPQFVNRKGVHTINCMMVCGPNYKFYYASAKWPGSVYDARVFRNSLLNQSLTDRWLPIEGAVILADSGYACTESSTPPLQKDGEVMTDAIKEFHRSHKKTRRIIEQSFGILKQRFAILQGLRVNPEFAGENVLVCCILHNIIIEGAAGDNNLDDEDAFLLNCSITNSW